MTKREYNRMAQRRWRAAHPIKAKRYHREYGRRKRLEAIGTRTHCDICKRRRRLVLDHDPEVARKRCNHHPMKRSCPRCRRGALCYGCNVALGSLEKHLTSAVHYIKQWRKR